MQHSPYFGHQHQDQTPVRNELIWLLQVKQLDNTVFAMECSLMICHNHANKSLLRVAERQNNQQRDRQIES